MPVRTGQDSKGCYAQYGNQKKYYYRCGDETAKERAKRRAERQAQAIRASGYKEPDAE